MQEEIVVNISDGKFYNVIRVGPERVVIDERFFEAARRASKDYEDTIIARFAPKPATDKE